MQTQGLEWASGRAVFEGRLDECDLILATNLMLYRRDQQTGTTTITTTNCRRLAWLIGVPNTSRTGLYLTVFFRVSYGLPGNSPIQRSHSSVRTRCVSWNYRRQPYERIAGAEAKMRHLRKRWVSRRLISDQPSLEACRRAPWRPLARASGIRLLPRWQD